jgi:hypothetical protein
MLATAPPPIPNLPARAVEVEVLPPPPPPPPRDGTASAAPPTATAGTPIHPIAAVLLLVVDNLWNLADWTVLGWFFTVPLSFLCVALPTFILQRKRLGQGVGKSLGWSLLLGGIAAVPFSVAGTTVGAVLLAWLGIRRLSMPSLPVKP